MKFKLTLILLQISVYSSGQTINFRNPDDRGNWIMNYYKDPSPQYLFEAFKVVAQNKEIAKAGSRSIMMGFFASCLRNDTVLQMTFFKELELTRNSDLIHGFGLVLWFIHTSYSLTKLQEFEKLKHVKKYDQDFALLRDSEFTDIWQDSIRDPDHLDMLWADFFATGSSESIKKIITKVPDYDSIDSFDRTVANAAIWSLTSNSIHHKRVFEICKDQINKTDEKTKKMLEEIIRQASIQRE